MKKEENIFREHKVRTVNGYTPRYKEGFIGVHFLDDERKGLRYKTVSEDGNLIIDYHDLFCFKDTDIVKYFEDKYNVKMSEYRSGTDDYYHYFECEVGKEDEVMKLIYQDKMVIVVDYVDERWLNAEDIIEDLIGELEDLKFCANSDKDIEKKVEYITKKIKDIL